MLGARLYFILTMLFEENLMEKVETVEFGEGLRLWILLVTDFEPRFASRKMVLQQGIFHFSFGASEDPHKGSIVWIRESDSIRRPPKKKIDDDTDWIFVESTCDGLPITQLIAW